MNRSLNRITLIGTVGRGPEMRYTPRGRSVTSFAICMSELGRDATDGRPEGADWFNVVAWDGLAKSCTEQVTSGQRAYVEGCLQIRGWTGSDSVRRCCLEVVARDVIVFGGSQGMAPGAGVPEGLRGQRGSE